MQNNYDKKIHFDLKYWIFQNIPDTFILNWQKMQQEKLFKVISSEWVCNYTGPIRENLKKKSVH